MNMGIKKSGILQKQSLATEAAIEQQAGQKAAQASSTNASNAKNPPTLKDAQLPPDLSKVLDNKAPMLNNKAPAAKGFNPLSMRMIDVDTPKGPTLEGRTFGFMADLAVRSGKAKNLDGAPVKNPNDYPNFSLTSPDLMDMDKQVFVIDDQLFTRQSGMGPEGDILSKWTDAGPVLGDAELKKASADLVKNATESKSVDGPGVDNPNDFPNIDITSDGLMGNSTSLYVIRNRLFTQQSGMGAEGKFVTRWMDIGPIPTTPATVKSNIDLVKDAIKEGARTELGGSPVQNPNDFPTFELTPPGLMGMDQTAFLIKGDLVTRQSGMTADGMKSKWTSHGPAPKALLKNVTDALRDAEEQANLVALDGPPKSNMNDFAHFTITPDGLMDMSKEAYLIDDKLFIAQSGMMAGGQIGTRWFEAGDAPKF